MQLVLVRCFKVANLLSSLNLTFVNSNIQLERPLPHISTPRDRRAKEEQNNNSCEVSSPSQAAPFPLPGVEGTLTKGGSTE